MPKPARIVIAFLLIVWTGGFAAASNEDVNEGIRAYQTRDFARAREIFAQLVKTEPSARNFELLAMSEAAVGQNDAAITHFQQSIRLGNHIADVHYKLGLSYLQRKDTALGARQILLALAIDHKLNSARYTLAVVLLDAGRAEEALPYLLQLRGTSPCDAAVWANLARAQFEVGDSKAALRTIDEASHGMTNNVPLLVTLAAICSRYQQSQKSRYLLESANELSPDDADIKLLLAKASLEAKEPVEAIAVLKDVAASEGKPGVIPFTRGLGLALTGQEASAEKEFSDAVNASPDSVRYWLALAWVYQLENRQEEALSTLARVREKDSNNAIVPYRMGVSSFLLRHYDETIQDCKEAIRMIPRYDQAYFLLGIARFEQGDSNAAQSAIEQAVSLAPENALYHRELGTILFKGGHPAEGKKEIDQAITLDPKAALNYLARARLLAGTGDDELAIRDLETTVALQPDNKDAYSELAKLYQTAGQPEKAAAMFAKAKEIQADPESEYRHDFLSGMADPLR